MKNIQFTFMRFLRNWFCWFSEWKIHWKNYKAKFIFHTTYINICKTQISTHIWFVQPPELKFAIYVRLWVCIDRYLKKYTCKIIQKCAILSEKFVKLIFKSNVFYFLNQTRNCIQTFEVKKFFRDIKCRRDDLPETTYLPLGANATTLTPYLCPGNSDICCFSCTSHIRTHGACPHSPVTKYLQKNTKISWNQYVF